MTLTELAEKYGESIDNLPMDVLMEAIYNERNAFDARVLHGHESEEETEASGHCIYAEGTGRTR